jgi:hypothetical protein
VSCLFAAGSLWEMAMLSFSLNSLVRMSSADNRAVYMRVSKTQGPDALPAIDLIPRVRYKIPCLPYPHQADLSSPHFFDAGLLVMAEPSADGLVRHVVVCNLGDRIHRLCTGCRVLCPPSDAAGSGGSSAGGDSPAASEEAQVERLATGSQNLASPEGPG